MASQIILPNVEALIPIFSGTYTENFNSFLRDFNRVATVYNWKDGMKHLWFRARLSGDARKIWDKICFEEDEDEDILFDEALDTFKDCLKYREKCSEGLGLKKVKNESQSVVVLKFGIEIAVEKYLKNRIDIETRQGWKVYEHMAFEMLLKISPQEWAERIRKAQISTFGKALKFLEQNFGTYRELANYAAKNNIEMKFEEYWANFGYSTKYGREINNSDLKDSRDSKINSVQVDLVPRVNEVQKIEFYNGDEKWEISDDNSDLKDSRDSKINSVQVDLVPRVNEVQKLEFYDGDEKLEISEDRQVIRLENEIKLKPNETRVVLVKGDIDMKRIQNIKFAPNDFRKIGIRCENRLVTRDRKPHLRISNQSLYTVTLEKGWIVGQIILDKEERTDEIKVGDNSKDNFENKDEFEHEVREKERKEEFRQIILDREERIDEIKVVENCIESFEETDKLEQNENNSKRTKENINELMGIAKIMKFENDQDKNIGIQGGNEIKIKVIQNEIGEKKVKMFQENLETENGKIAEVCRVNESFVKLVNRSKISAHNFTESSMNPRVRQINKTRVVNSIVKSLVCKNNVAQDFLGVKNLVGRRYKNGKLYKVKYKSRNDLRRKTIKATNLYLDEKRKVILRRNRYGRINRVHRKFIRRRKICEFKFDANKFLKNSDKQLPIMISIQPNLGKEINSSIRKQSEIVEVTLDQGDSNVTKKNDKEIRDDISRNNENKARKHNYNLRPRN